MESILPSQQPQELGQSDEATAAPENFMETFPQQQAGNEALAKELGKSVEGNASQDDSCAASKQSKQVVSGTGLASQERILNTSALDGLRALGVFHIVLGHHAFYTEWPSQKFEDGFDLLGGVSMGLFYILSGFVLMLGYGNDDNEPKNCRTCLGCCNCCDFVCNCMCLGAQPGAGVPGAFDSRRFYWKRFARLGPLWYLGNFLAFHLFFTNYWFFGPPERWWPGVVLMLPPLGLNSWFLLFPPAGHLWTISTMTFFYLIFPKLYYRVRRIQPEKLRAFAMTCFGIQAGIMSVTGLGLGMLVHPIAGYWFARAWPLCRLPVFVMGMCAARQCQFEARGSTIHQTCGSFEDCGMTKGVKVAMLLLIFMFVVLLGIAEQVVDGPGFVRFLGEIVLPVNFYDLIIALTFPAGMAEAPSCLHKLFQCRVLRFFADISLGVYVLHETLIRSFALVWRGPVELGPDGSPEDVNIRMTPWGAPIVMVLSVFLGWCVTRFFEKPMSKAILNWALKDHTSQ